MRLNLTRMAVAGQGGDPYSVTEANMADQDFQPYFADDVSSLMTAIQEALIFVKESQIKMPGKGGYVESSGGEEGNEGTVNMFSTSYRVSQGNQWVGSLNRYIASLDQDGRTVLSHDWELGNELVKKRGNGDTPATQRNLRYWKNGDFVSLTGGNDDFKKLTGMIDSRMDAGNIENGFVGKPAPAEALYKWFQGYDYSYGKNKSYPRSSMLSDFGRGAVAYVGYPTATSDDELPGFSEWAETFNHGGEPERLYAQTNDGVLHVVVPSTGDEEIALLPPPSLLPSRLATLKTHTAEEKLRWFEVNGSERTAGFRSYPAYTLDGPLLKRAIDLSQTGATRNWGNYLLGTLGRGGNGLYMLDVTAPSAPKFVWYRENLGDYLVTMAGNASEPTLTKSALVSAADAPYKKLGYNSPKPAMGVTGEIEGSVDFTNFIALSGGVQSSYNPSQNGNEGAVLLLINPADGSVIRAFDGDSLVGSKTEVGSGPTGLAPYMGMMVTEPMLVRSRKSRYLTGRIFTADNRGNIFMLSMVNEVDDTTPLPVNDWSMRPLASLQANSTAASSASDNYAMPYGFAASYDGVTLLWVGGGTSNVITKRNLAVSGDKGVIENKEQMIFSFKLPDGDVKPYVRGEDFTEVAASSNETIGAGKNGWYIPLRKETDGQNVFDEYVSAKPTSMGSTMYIATFQQKKLDLDNLSPCFLTRNVAGDSRLYALDMRTGGAAAFKDEDGNLVKYITMEDIKITDTTVKQDVDGNYILELVYDALSENGDFSELANNGGEKTQGTDDRATIQAYGKGKGGGGGTGIDALEGGGSAINYWLAR
jgi:Tfp pilus tip-associated adhesin PilY1